MAGPRWQPAKPKTRIKVVDCGASHWDDPGLDIPHELETFNFRVMGTGHERIERIFADCCAHRRYAAGLGDKPLEQRHRQVDLSARLLIRHVRHKGSIDRDRVRAGR